MKRLITATVGATLAVLCFSASAAEARAVSLPTLGVDPVDSIVDITRTCEQTGMQQRFLDWGDEIFYVPAPGGSFERGAGEWELSAGASLIRRGNTLGTNRGAVRLTPGSSVLSPPICVDIDYTVSRLFALTGKVRRDSHLKVEVIYPELLGGESAQVTNLPPVKRRWGPTEHFQMPIAHQLGIPSQLLNGEPAEVRFRFSVEPTDRSIWTIDDVWVDPRMRR